MSEPQDPELFPPETQTEQMLRAYVRETDLRYAREMMDLCESAWGLIANAGWDAHSGNTALDKTPGWHEAAIRWRDKYHGLLREICQ